MIDSTCKFLISLWDSMLVGIQSDSFYEKVLTCWAALVLLIVDDALALNPRRCGGAPLLARRDSGRCDDGVAL